MIDNDANLSTEHSEWVEYGEFPRTIAPFASDKDEAVKEVREHMDRPDE